MVLIYTLRELLFAGTKFLRFFRIWAQTTKLSSRKKSQNCEQQKLVPVTNSFLKVFTCSVMEDDMGQLLASLGLQVMASTHPLV